MKTVKRIFAVLLTVCMLFGLSVSAAGAGTGDARLRGVPNSGTITVEKAIEGAEYKAYQMLALYEYATGDNEHVYVVTDAWKDFFVDTTAAGTDKTATALKDYFLVEEFASDTGTYYVSWVEVANETDEAKQARMEAFAGLAEAYIENKGETLAPNGIDTAEKIGAAADSPAAAVITNLPMGYYFINTNGGSAVIINTFVPDATVEEKNSAPTLEKKVKDERDTTATGDAQWQDDSTANIGDTVMFKTTITVGAGAVGYKLHDAMTEGLTFGNVTSVKLYKASGEGTNVTYTEDATLNLTDHYTVNTDTAVCSGTVKATPEAAASETCDFEVVFVETIFAKDGFDVNGTKHYIAEGDRLVVEYTATLNANAVVAGAGNPNRTVLTYGNTPTATPDAEPPLKTPQDETTTYTYEFDLVKTDKNNVVLSGATFELRPANAAGEYDGTVAPLKLETDATGYKVTAAESGTTTITAGNTTITGLGQGKYYLTEITSPNGYKMLSKPVLVEIIQTEGNKKATVVTTGEGVDAVSTWQNGGVQVINVKKTIFPHTGGMGTTVYYLAGGAIVALVAASAVIVFKKRQNGKV